MTSETTKLGTAKHVGVPDRVLPCDVVPGFLVSITEAAQ